ncbi:hypothetical protein K501DRAFT_30771 [Backusella circina FSU 941]|nr:hypothetical protein K501DRAFT_30771 [Backusella circina FSU 941]
MKSTAIFLVLSACLLQLGTASVVECSTVTRSICENFQGGGRVCGCSTDNYTCTQRTATYAGECQGQNYLDLCEEFCSNGGHICKGEVGGTCNDEEMVHLYAKRNERVIGMSWIPVVVVVVIYIFDGIYCH